jgi:hypothetical protein
VSVSQTGPLAKGVAVREGKVEPPSHPYIRTCAD